MRENVEDSLGFDYCAQVSGRKSRGGAEAPRGFFCWGAAMDDEAVVERLMRKWGLAAEAKERAALTKRQQQAAALERRWALPPRSDTSRVYLEDVRGRHRGVL